MSDGTPFAIANAATVPAAALCDAFNAAFSDYLLTFAILDTDGWRAFVQRQGIDVAMSSVARRGDTAPSRRLSPGCGGRVSRGRIGGGTGAHRASCIAYPRGSRRTARRLAAARI